MAEANERYDRKCKELEEAKNKTFWDEIKEIFFGGGGNSEYNGYESINHND